MSSAENIGIMNPRLNCAYMMPAKDIPVHDLEYIRTGVIGLGVRGPPPFPSPFCILFISATATGMQIPCPLSLS